MLSTFAWSQDYETGNQMVDREHRALLELVSLILVLDQNEDIEERDKALKVELAALHRYADQHFVHEEKLLDAVDSPYLAKQRLQYNALRSGLYMHWIPGQESPSRDTIHQLALWSRDHLLAHFLEEDYNTFHSSSFTGLND